VDRFSGQTADVMMACVILVGKKNNWQIAPRKYVFIRIRFQPIRQQGK
jgi:hypothetical protein